MNISTKPIIQESLKNEAYSSGSNLDREHSVLIRKRPIIRRRPIAPAKPSLMLG